MTSDTMRPVQLGDDDGFVSIEMGGREKRLDLYQIGNRLLDMQQRSRGKPMTEQHQAIVDLLEEEGFPTVSQRMADRFACAIFERMEELGAFVKKKDNSGESPSPTPSSRGSTELPSSTEAPEKS